MKTTTTKVNRITLGALAFAALASWSGAVVAQSDPERIRELERKLERSLQMIEQLTRRVNELERTPAAPASPARAQEARIEALEKNVSQIAATPAASADSGTPLRGFADVGYEHSRQARDDGRRGGFVVGNLDLYLTPTFGDRVKTLAELVFEVDSEGGLATDLERLQMGYTVSDALTAWIGRWHTPYGYWNTAFHHGAQIQTAITRPRFIDFEDKGGILPSHSVGLWASGQVRLGTGKLQYDAYVANGNRISEGVLDFNAARDDNSDKLVGANLAYKPGGALDGLVLGVHGFREEVASDTAGGSLGTTRVGMAGGYFFLERDEWEGIGEYYRFRNKDLTNGSGTHTSWAAFVQVGRSFDLWTPYYRWEKTSLDAGDAYFAAQDSGRPYSRHSLGVRYMLNPKAAIKFEANRTKEGADDKSYNEARAQFAIRF